MPRFSGGAAGGGEVGAARDRAGQWQSVQRAGGRQTGGRRRRKEVGRHDAGGGRQSVAFYAGLFKERVRLARGLQAA